MRNSIQIPIIFIGILFSLPSCKKSGSCVNITNWLKGGHNYVYISSTPGTEDTLYMKYESENGGMIKYTQYWSDSSIAEKGRINACGNAIYFSMMTGSQPEIEFFRLNANVGDTWEHNMPNGGFYIVEYSYPNANVTVPAGNFRCKIFLHTITTSTGAPIDQMLYYVNDQLGVVKLEGLSKHYELVRTNFN